MNTEPIKVTACYHFSPIAPQRLAELSDDIERLGDSTGIRGLLILGTEGINTTFAGEEDAAEKFYNGLSSFFPGETLTVKHSYSSKNPFKHFRVVVRKEIVTTGTDISPLKEAEDDLVKLYLSPGAWHERLTRGDEVTLLDTRNFYESAIGKFKGAITPEIRNFRQFPDFVKNSELPKDRPVFMYCTGGIRCEKAALEMKKQGFHEVYQLRGGILKYIEEFPDQLFEGECFVFDNRVAVDQSLEPSTRYSFCPHCGNPAEQVISCIHCGKDARVCKSCLKFPEKETCSKNCAYQWSFRNRRKAAA